jgi:2-polyprenyl-3-methyl-5-hydroxy-6-metoxy-1,4-benzoquinol methylase
VRLKYIRDQIDQHWQGDECSRTPLAGKTALDVGCGAGLLAEPLARLGAKVTGIDASPEVIAVAREHALDAPRVRLDHIGVVSARRRRRLFRFSGDRG